MEKFKYTLEKYGKTFGFLATFKVHYFPIKMASKWVFCKMFLKSNALPFILV
jgi:hypothetical protein